ncbi:hypothetical protein FQN60_006552, partial [Etheostoma spectabile]
MFPKTSRTLPESKGGEPRYQDAVVMVTNLAVAKEEHFTHRGRLGMSLCLPPQKASMMSFTAPLLSFLRTPSGIRAQMDLSGVMYLLVMCALNKLLVATSLADEYQEHLNHRGEYQSTRNQIATAQFECFQKILKDSHRKTKTIAGPVCNATWDGWLCWDETEVGTTEQGCPDYFKDFDPHAMASKVCSETGEWGRHPESNRTWTNFTNCQANTTHHGTAAMTHFYLVMIGHGLSLVSLLISLGIFFHFKSLSCQRITLHKNLFFSFVLNSIITVVWLTTVVQKQGHAYNDSVNLFFLLNIVRVLITKLRVTHQAESSLYMRAVRATLILIPLLGIQFVLLPYKPQDHWVYEIYLYVMEILMHYQGLLVSTIFCFFNGEFAGTFANADFFRSASYVASSLTEVHRCYSIESHTEHMNGKSYSDIFRSDSPFVSYSPGRQASVHLNEVRRRIRLQHGPANRNSLAPLPVSCHCSLPCHQAHAPLMIWEK